MNIISTNKKKIIVAKFETKYFLQRYSSYEILNKHNIGQYCCKTVIDI